MSCTCTEDKEQIGNMIIGRNKVTCQECIDAQVSQEKHMKKQMKAAELTALELKSLRKLFDGEDLTVVNKQRADIRAEIQGL